MAGPYRCTDMLVKIDGSTVGVVVGMEINVSYEGGTVDHVYGQNTGYISHGGKRGTFTLQRLLVDAGVDVGDTVKISHPEIHRGVALYNQPPFSLIHWHQSRYNN